MYILFLLGCMWQQGRDFEMACAPLTFFQFFFFFYIPTPKRPNAEGHLRNSDSLKLKFNCLHDLHILAVYSWRCMETQTIGANLEVKRMNWRYLSRFCPSDGAKQHHCNRLSGLASAHRRCDIYTLFIYFFFKFLFSVMRGVEIPFGFFLACVCMCVHTHFLLKQLAVPA